MRLLEFRASGVPKRLLDRLTPRRSGNLIATLLYFSALIAFAYSMRFWNSGLLLGDDHIVFPDTHVDASSSPQELLLTNTGNASVRLGPMRITGGQAEAFRIRDDSCTDDLVPINSSCTVHLEFRPLQAGPNQTLLTLGSSDVDSPHRVTLSGTGVLRGPVSPKPDAATTLPGPAPRQATKPPPQPPQPPQPPPVTPPKLTYTGSLVPNPLVFGNVTLPASAASPTITSRLTNTGTGSLSITAVSIEDAGQGIFQLSNNTCDGHSVAPGASCTIDVQFRPTAPGNFTAKLRVATNAIPTLAVADMTGVGVSPALPSVLIDSSNLDFLSQYAGDQRVALKIVTLRAGSDAPYVVQQVRLVSGDSKVYSIENNNCTNASLTRTTACTFAVHFKPRGNGDLLGTVNVTSANSGTPATLSVKGRSYNSTLAFNPSQLTFALPTPAQLEMAARVPPPLPSPQSIAVTNASPVPVRITTVQIVAGSSNLLAEGLAMNGLGTASQIFIANGGCTNAQLAPGERCEITVSLGSPSVIAQHAYLVVASSPSNAKVNARLDIQ